MVVCCPAPSRWTTLCSPWGEQLRLARNPPGDIWARCRCWTAASAFGLQHTHRLRNRRALSRSHGRDDERDPQLAASLIALLARKLSLRLRVVKARAWRQPKVMRVMKFQDP